MAYEYTVSTFKPTVKGCGATDKGWNKERCDQFAEFLNNYAQEGWRLHSQEYREVKMGGCSGGKGATLVCTFERKT